MPILVRERKVWGEYYLVAALYYLWQRLHPGWYAFRMDWNREGPISESPEIETSPFDLWATGSTERRRRRGKFQMWNKEVVASYLRTVRHAVTERPFATTRRVVGPRRMRSRTGFVHRAVHDTNAFSCGKRRAPPPARRVGTFQARGRWVVTPPAQTDCAASRTRSSSPGRGPDRPPWHPAGDKTECGCCGVK